MPLTGQAKTDYQRAYMRDRRAAERRTLDLLSPVATMPANPAREWPADPVDALVEWASETLVVPSGMLAARPWRFDDWQIDWFRAAMADGVFEAGLSVARKNGKSGMIAALLLAYLAGPLCRSEWRGVVVSMSGNLAKELKGAMEGTAIASGLHDVQFMATPYPGRALGRLGSRVDFLAADRGTGHAIGADLAIIDEAGQLAERDRPLWAAIFSSISGRAGRLMAISIRGDGPMFGELADRADEAGVHWKEWAAPGNAALDDRDAWHAANPGLASGIKAVSYMEHAARRAAANPNDQSLFRSHDLNLPVDPGREVIVTVAQWLECVTDAPPPRDGDCVVGLDIGGSSSMTAAVAYWPATGRLECWGAFPTIPDLRARGEADGVGGLYERMHEGGELAMMGGRVTDPVAFIAETAERLRGARIVAMAADRYRKEEVRDAMARAAVIWPLQWRGQGHSATADGSADVRGFQSEVLTGAVRTGRSLLMEAAIASSSIVRDSAGNPKLDKARAKGRIDALQAAVLAVGLGARWRAANARRGATGAYKGAV